MIPFKNGEPVDGPDSKTAAMDVFGNADNSACPQHCLRPVGLAFDSQDRMYVSSDATGEIYVVMKDTQSTGTQSTGTATTATSSSSSPGSTSAATRCSYRLSNVVLLLAGFMIVSVSQ